jgi:hypothetical protein
MRRLIAPAATVRTATTPHHPRPPRRCSRVGPAVHGARESIKGVLLGTEAGSERPDHRALESPLSTAFRIPGNPRLAGWRAWTGRMLPGLPPLNGGRLPRALGRRPVPHGNSLLGAVFSARAREV